MTTTTSPTAELERAEAELDDAREAHDKAQAEFTKAAAGLPSYSRPEDNPKFGELDKARQRVAAARGLVEHLRRASLRERLAEFDVSDAEDAIRAAFEQVVRACDAYRHRLDQARAICAETRPLNGQAIDADERVHQWRKVAASALEAEFTPAGLNRWGAAKLDEALARDAERS